MDLSNFATTRELEHTTGIGASDLAAKKEFIALKSEVDKLKTVPVELKNLNDAVDNEVVKNTKFNTLKTKVNNSEKKIPDATTLTQTNQYNTDKQNLDKKIGDADKKIQDTSGLVTTTVLNATISEVENKIPNTIILVTLY